MPSLPLVAGDVFASELHSGPGAGDLRDFSRAWHDNANEITHWADDTRTIGFKVSEHWSSGDEAAHNIVSHAKWLDSAAAWAEGLSVAAEAVAHAFDVASTTPPLPMNSPMPSRM
ncbi:PPE domain-containing protein [Mycobacterium antarcticum]|uniref:PPE domain-containing protein n=1 Tax=Mycolicibacterium sp. TUM20983 TaxID=3023369 RepID=UPI0024E19414|nr:PPE domain-containing protein [Mycolicibacterium sp. TUM20983]